MRWSCFVSAEEGEEDLQPRKVLLGLSRMVEGVDRKERRAETRWVAVADTREFVDTGGL